MIIFVKRWR